MGWIDTSRDQTASAGRCAAQYTFEIRLGWICLLFTVIAWIAVSLETGGIFVERLRDESWWPVIEQGVFILIVQGMLYGSFVYQFCRLGYLYRRRQHRPTASEARGVLHAIDAAPSLTILVPSYKEELAVVRRTLMSAALQDYPNRRIALLLDDPPNSPDPRDQKHLAAVRLLCSELQAIFDQSAEPFIKAQREFETRRNKGWINPAAEAVLIALQYRRAAEQIERLAATCPADDHADRLLHEKIFQPLAASHHMRASQLNNIVVSDTEALSGEYSRLAKLFHVELASFERKRYVNLSHEPNKAMNLNSYLGLLGKQWRVVERADGSYLAEGCGFIAPPATDFILTLDADSMVVPEYAATLVNEMQRPGNERLAVAQTPYNAIPGCTSLLERTAGATTDIQYLIHQGFTRFGATYWVGANALLRMTALQDIRTEVEERGFRVPVFIQDRTVIEDTESSVDLVSRGWQLYNYPERLAFSATPPDFGSLLIQRRRWANGGLILLPKLLGYLARSRRIGEGFFRIHYLVSISLVNVGFLVLLAHSFQDSFSSLWLPLTAIPFFLLNARDLRYSGYRARDMLRIYALNLLLLPVNLGGVMKSLEQAVTGKRIPFGRTPKVSGRTGVPTLYVAAAYALAVLCFGLATHDMHYRRWNAATFHLGNGLVLAYAIWSFIGVRESIEDVRAGVLARMAAWSANSRTAHARMSFRPGDLDPPPAPTPRVSG
jgi:cellulose synthase/poly-beta-1,6-N-acetylglucosamine synthase-like glycosyltransferase